MSEQNPALEDTIEAIIKSGCIPSATPSEPNAFGASTAAVPGSRRWGPSPRLRRRELHVAAALSLPEAEAGVVGAVSTGVVFPKHRGDLLSCAVVAERMREGAIEAPVDPAQVVQTRYLEEAAARGCGGRGLCGACGGGCGGYGWRRSNWCTVCWICEGERIIQ